MGGECLEGAEIRLGEVAAVQKGEVATIAKKEAEDASEILKAGGAGLLQELILRLAGVLCGGTQGRVKYPLICGGAGRPPLQ